MNYKKNYRSIFMSLMLAITMCFLSMSVFATSVSAAPDISVVQQPTSAVVSGYDKEEGMYYVEFSANEAVPASDGDTYVDQVTVLSEPWYGNEMVCNHSLLTASAAGDSSGLTITVKLKKYNAILGYLNVSGSERSFVCDGQTHAIYNSFSVTSGAKYRMYYAVTGGKFTSSVNITLVAYFWDR